MDKKWLLIMTFNLYLIPISIVVLLSDINSSFVKVLIISIFCLIFTSIVFMIINIMYAIKLGISKKIGSYRNFKTILIFKITWIPFYIINLLIWIIYFGAMANPFLMILWLLIPIGVIYTYMILLSTSLYVIGILISNYSEGTITKKQFSIHILAQLLFVGDILDMIILRKVLISNKVKDVVT